jgi:hypothetical protein
MATGRRDMRVVGSVMPQRQASQRGHATSQEVVKCAVLGAKQTQHTNTTNEPRGWSERPQHACMQDTGVDSCAESREHHTLAPTKRGEAPHSPGANCVWALLLPPPFRFLRICHRLSIQTDSSFLHTTGSLGISIPSGSDDKSNPPWPLLVLL